MSDEDCYIYTEDEKLIRIQCAQCHEENKLGQFWDASNGYGPWDINCCKCGKAIHRFQEKLAINTNLET